MKLNLVMVMAAMVAGCGGGGPATQADSGFTDDASTMDQDTADNGMTPTAVCGDEVLDESEPCDGDLLDGATCESLGYLAGTPSCLPDCRGLDLTECTVAPIAQTTTPVAPLAIPDNGYDGTIASMACVDVVVPEGTRGYVNNEAFAVELTMDHTFIGDLVVKLVAPSGHVSTLMHRPGLSTPMDDGDLSGGAVANIVSTHPITLARGIGGFISESLGNNLTTAQAPCRDNMYCNYVATSTVGPNDVSREPVAGTWRICVGDAATGDTGTITSVELQLTTTTQPEPAVSAGELLNTAMADGAFDGTIASMACRTFDFTGLDPSLRVLSITAQYAIAHGNAGDIVFAIVSPDGEPHAMGVRPGVAEAADGSSDELGAVADLVVSPRVSIGLGGLVTSYTDAELMGDGTDAAGLVCPADSNCNFTHNEGALSWTSGTTLLGESATGMWQVCAGDARTGSTGTFDYAVIGIDLAP